MKGQSTNNTTESYNKILKKAQQRARAARRAKSVFIANMSHELRTPMAGILGMAQILEKEVQAEPGKEAIAHLAQAAHTLMDLFNQVIEFSKLKQGELPLTLVEIDIVALFSHTFQLFIPAMKAKGLNFLLNINPENIPSSLISDTPRLQRILLNLLSNAVRFTEKGSVSLSVEFKQENSQHGFLHITVADTGIGIPQNQQKSVFTRFKKLLPSYISAAPAYGLGLCIVKKFMDDLQGEIILHSEEGKGTTFRCQIPMEIGVDKKVYSSTEQQDFSLPDIPPSHCCNILLVEDHPMVQLVTRKQLENIGCQVAVASTGEEALTLAQNNHYDLIFMDIGLPGKDGCEITREIHANPDQAGIPIVALTAHVDPDNADACLAAGMVAVLTKPVEVWRAKEILQTYTLSPSTSEALSSLPPLIDLAVGEKLGYSKELAQEMLQHFMDLLPEAEQNLKAAYQARDWRKLSAEVHKLQGGAIYCSLPRITLLAQQLEKTLSISNEIKIIERDYLNLCDAIQHTFLYYPIKLE